MFISDFHPRKLEDKCNKLQDFIDYCFWCSIYEPLMYGFVMISLVADCLSAYVVRRYALHRAVLRTERRPVSYYPQEVYVFEMARPGSQSTKELWNSCYYRNICASLMSIGPCIIVIVEE